MSLAPSRAPSHVLTWVMAGGGHSRISALQGDQGSPGLASRPSLTCCSQSVEPMRPVASAGYSALAGLRPLPTHSPTPGWQGCSFSCSASSLPWDPSDVDQAWDLHSWGAGLLQSPLSPERRQNACASCCRELTAHHLFLFSVQGAPLQGGGVGLCWLHHAHRGVLQEQGRVLGSGEEAAQLTRGEGASSACAAGWMLTHVTETPCQARGWSVAAISPWWSAGELASWGAASHGPVSHARSGRVPGSAVTCWGGARVLGRSPWEERGRSGRYLDVQHRLLVGGPRACSEPEPLTALWERAFRVVE